MEMDQWKKLNHYFHLLEEMEPEAREAWLDNFRLKDPNLAAELESLLATDEDLDADSFLERPVLGLAQKQPQLEVGQSIGPYRLTEVLGEGGMGTVFLAEQTEPMTRKVALKVIRGGFSGSYVEERFRLELKTLATMNHPFIAHVYDAGVTKYQQPYFSMEYIEGEPITEYCDRLQLSIKSRLLLFTKVCNAIQYAHQKGVIHRDIKPANVLVTEREGQGIPKVIDFGISKALGADSSPEALGAKFEDDDNDQLTKLGAAIGSLGYMSPEQTGKVTSGVDTRTDVYSLGVLLYELLCGFLPLKTDYLGRDDLQLRLQHICEVAPTSLEQQMSQDPSSVKEKANARGMDPGRMLRSFRGELDWLTQKTLAKDKEDRYDSVADLRQDVFAYLDGRPLKAARQGATYRLKKFVLRHKIQVAAGVVAFLAVLAGLLGVLISAEKARQEADKAKRTLTLLQEFLGSVDPTKDGPQLKVTNLLNQFSQRLEQEFHPEPEIEAALRHTIGSTYRGLGLFDLAESHLLEAVDQRQSTEGPLHEETLESQTELGRVYLGKADYQLAEKHFEKILKIQESLHGPDHHLAHEVRNLLAATYYHMGNPKAETLYLQARDGFYRHFGPNHRRSMDIDNNLALFYMQSGRLNEAETLMQQTILRRRQGLGKDHPDTLQSEYNLAAIMEKQGKIKEALEQAQKTLALQREVFGEKHHITIRTYNLMGVLHLQQGKWAEAESFFTTSLDHLEQTLGEFHPNLIFPLTNLSFAIFQQGRIEEALELCRKNLARTSKALGDMHRDTLDAQGNLIYFLYNAGKEEEALAVSKDLNDKFSVKKGIDQSVVLENQDTMASLYQALGQMDRAEVINLECAQGFEKLLGSQHPRTIAAYQKCAQFYKDQGKPQKAVPFFEKAWQAERESLGPASEETLKTMLEYADTLLASGQQDRGQQLLNQCKELISKHLKPDHQLVEKFKQLKQL